MAPVAYTWLAHAHAHTNTIIPQNHKMKHTNCALSYQCWVWTLHSYS